LGHLSRRSLLAGRRLRATTGSDRCIGGGVVTGPAAGFVPASVVKIGVRLVSVRIDRRSGLGARGRGLFLGGVRVDVGLVDVGLVLVRLWCRRLAEAVVAPVVVILRARTLILPARLPVRL
jgi:hypothetical protein